MSQRLQAIDVKFKDNAGPRCMRPRTVPIAMIDDLHATYDIGISKGLYKSVSFNNYAAPVVPMHKQSGSLRVVCDYSLLDHHRQPISPPEDLFRKLSGTFFTIDLVDVYHQIELKVLKVALSTHRGVLLQTRLPFGISSATFFFKISGINLRVI